MRRHLGKRDAEESKLSDIDKYYSAPHKWIMKIFDGYIADISCLLTGGEQGASLILGSRLRAGAAISFVR